jgi:hypothetical protein
MHIRMEYTLVLKMSNKVQTPSKHIIDLMGKVK